MVTNNDQAAAIAADPELAQQLMGGLGKLGLVGLGLVPGGLRHPFAFGSRPLLGAERLHATRSSTCARTQACRPCWTSSAPSRTTASTANATAQIRGRLRGIEISMQQAQAVDLPAVQTANVTLYEKFDVAVVRQRHLGRPHRDATRRAPRGLRRQAAKKAVGSRDE